MPNSPLIAKLHAHATLLPSQRELLERVVFQLEFNGFQHIHLVGKAGSGKTTLSLVLAELLSDEMNLAYFSAQPGMTTQDCQKQLLQQWFGLSDYESSLMEQLELPHSQPLAWVLDSQRELPLSCLSMLRAHPVHIITTGPDVLTEADVNLTIPEITAADVRLLLPESAISAWSIEDRLVHAAGNLHSLLEPDTIAVESKVDSDVQTSGHSAMRYRLASLALAVVGALFIAGYWWMHDSNESVVDVPPADNEVTQRFQAPALHQQSALPRRTDVAADNGIDATQLPDEESAPQSEVSSEPEDTPEIIATELSEQDTLQVVPEAPALSPDETQETENTAATSAQVALPADMEADQTSTSEDTSTPYRYQEAELLAMDSGTFALQLGAFSSEAAAQRLMTRYSELTMHLYRRRQGNQLQWVVVMAPFDDAVTARNQRNQLSDALQAETPFAKPLRTLQQEIQQRLQDDSGNL